MEQSKGPAESRYNELSTERETYIIRARDSAQYTIPDLFPWWKPGTAIGANLRTPWQSVGARGVNNLSSKLLLALFPPNSPFFRLRIDEQVLRRISSEQNISPDDIRPRVEAAFGQVERSVLHSMEGDSFRTAAFVAIRQLTVSGNYLLYIPPKGGMKGYRLDQYVCKRDPMGQPIELVIKECVAMTALPENIKKAILDRFKMEGDRNPDSAITTVDIFTHIKLDGKWWNAYQEVKGLHIPGSDGTYAKDKCPWIPLRFIRVDGEDYGRGYVEEYLGDLRSLNSLMKAIVTGSLGAAKQIWMIRPGSVLRPKDLQKESGAIVIGDPQDVGVIQANKNADFNIAAETAQKIEERLSFAFLLANPRNAERVTAQEIRLLAGMLEDALGGVYSVLSQEFQRPLVNRYIHVMEKQKKLPSLPMNLVEIGIVTGMEALGRGHDLQRLDEFVGGIEQTLGPQAISEYLKISAYLTERAVAIGVDGSTLIKSETQVQQERQQAQQMQMVQQIAPNATKVVGDVVKNQVQQQNQPQG